MSKRRKTGEPELPLFDLPLYDEPDDEGLDGLALREEAPAPAAPKRARKRRRKAPDTETPLLFSEEELAAGTARSDSADLRLDDELEDATAVDEIRAPTALVQDRLLGGLADLTIHIATLGLMIVAVQLMGIPVALADWPAFAALTVIFSFLYSVIPLAFWGHTPGMAWVGHAARSEGDEPLSFGQTAMRWAGALFTVVFLGLPLLLALQEGGSLADRLSDSKTVQLD